MANTSKAREVMVAKAIHVVERGQVNSGRAVTVARVTSHVAILMRCHGSLCW